MKFLLSVIAGLVLLLASQSSAKPASNMYSAKNVKEAFLPGLLSAEENGLTDHYTNYAIPSIIILYGIITCIKSLSSFQLLYVS